MNIDTKFYLKSVSIHVSIITITRYDQIGFKGACPSHSPGPLDIIGVDWILVYRESRLSKYLRNLF